MKTEELEEIVSKKENGIKAATRAQEYKERLINRALDNNLCPDCGYPTTKISKRMWWRLFSKDEFETKRDFHTCSNGHKHIRKHYDYGM